MMEPLMSTGLYLCAGVHRHMIPLENSTPQESWAAAQKARISMLNNSMPFLPKALKRVADSKFEVLVRQSKIRKYFPIILSYCSKSARTASTSAAGHGAKREHLCVRCHTGYDDVATGRRCSSCAMAETIEM